MTRKRKPPSDPPAAAPEAELLPPDNPLPLQDKAPLGIKCLGYAGDKYYLIGEITPEVRVYRASELLRQPALCELRSAADWKAEAKDGKPDWPTEGAALLAACQKAGRFKVEPEADEKPKRRKLNGHAPEAAQMAIPFEGWTEHLQRSEHAYKGNDYNVTVALKLCPELAGKIGWDVRAMTYMNLAKTPAGEPGRWTDTHSARLAVWLQSHEIPVTTRHVDTGLAAAAQSIEVDPLGGYLNGIVWDGQERIGTWLHDYCQADLSDANSIIGSKWLIGAVARALRPGCRMDYMLVLEGEQGTKKSTLIKTLGGDYSGENLPDFHSRDAMQIASSKWIIEVAELTAIRRSEMDAIKAFITRIEDTYVPKYAKHPITVKRWSVLIGNVNPEGYGYLQDSTGNRRFWPVRVGAIDIEAVVRDRDQLWAEAVHCFRRGDAWWPDESETAPVVLQQEERQDHDDWLPIIERWATHDLQTDQVLENRREEFTTGDVAVNALGFLARDIARTDQMRIAKCLKQLGYQRVRKRGAITNRNVYVTQRYPKLELRIEANRPKD
jgi:putative DNA primase/helicase